VIVKLNEVVKLVDPPISNSRLKPPLARGIFRLGHRVDVWWC
jgi:hypothetical protein